MTTAPAGGRTTTHPSDIEIAGAIEGAFVHMMSARPFRYGMANVEVTEAVGEKGLNG